MSPAESRRPPAFPFARTYMVSAERGHGCDDLREWLAEQMPEMARPMNSSHSTITADLRLFTVQTRSFFGFRCFSFFF